MPAMSFNAEIVDAFTEMATLLEITGANAFKVNASAKVARTVEGMPNDLRPLAAGPSADKELAKLDGVGASSAKKIAEYARTGRIEALDALRAEVPDGLREVMRVPGLGPKTVGRLWKEAGIENLDALERGLADGSVEALPRMGRKTIDNLPR